MANEMVHVDKEIDAQIKALRKSNPELATALERIPRKDIVHLAKIRMSQQKPNKTVLPSSGKTLVTPPPGGEVMEQVAKKGLSKGMKIAGGAGLVAGALMPMFSASPLTLPGRQGKARDLAVKGFSALGASSSATALAEIVRQQELAARRQIVMQTYEPDMFNQVLNVLAGTGAAPSALTSSERQIGSNTERPLPARRPDKDIKFLLDQLMNEASG